MARILVIDDERECRMALRTMLAQNGYDTAGAGNGLEALAACLQSPPDLIVLNVAMAAMDGVLFLRLLRIHTRWRHIPVVLLTAQSSAPAIDQARQLGALAHFVKASLRPNAFLECIRRCLPTPLIRSRIGKRPIRGRHPREVLCRCHAESAEDGG